MNKKIVNCPHYGKILSEEVWKGRTQEKHTATKCPQCGGFKMWKDGKRNTPSGAKQRYLCRNCGYRFSEQ